jgi:hypothetical protein
MLRLIAAGQALPFSWPVDPSCHFEPGMIAQLTTIGNQVMATVSNGTAPIGIIDDIKTKAYTNTAWDETVITRPLVGIPGPNNTIVSPYDIKLELNNPNVVPNSFISIPVDVQLIPRNGVVIFPAGTVLNYDLLGTGTPNAIKTNVRYAYQVPNIIGEDSTYASQRVTIWYERIIAESNKFETNQIYPVNANLFVSEEGLLTSRQPFPNSPCVALVTGCPNALISTFQFMWL